MENQQDNGTVRYGRVPKRSREKSAERENSKVTTSDEADHSGESEMKNSPLFSLISALSQAHAANCGYIDDLTQNLSGDPLVFPPGVPERSGVASSTAEAREKQRCWIWQNTASRLTPSIQRVVEFAKRVPGFVELQRDDQLILLKQGFLEIWFCHVAKLTTDTSLMFEDGTKLSKQQLEIMWDVEFVNLFLEFTRSLNSLQLSDEEIGVFSGVILLTSERTGIIDLQKIELLQDRTIEAMKFQLTRNRPDDSRTYDSLLSKMPQLRILGNRITIHLEWLRDNWTKIPLPPLFAEVFDIPRDDSP